jgi:hypothetical protein
VSQSVTVSYQFNSKRTNSNTNTILNKKKLEKNCPNPYVNFCLL